MRANTITTFKLFN